jgi:cation:H+ antiporter
MLTHFVIFTVSLLMLWKGADWLVASASRIARTLGVSELFIGLTVVALGTSAPEFAVTVGAAARGFADISLANVVGSNIFNLGMILGAVALFSMIETNRQMVWRDGAFLLIATLIVTGMCGNYRLARTEGIVLISLLIGYLAVLFIKRQAIFGELEDVDEMRRSDIPLVLIGFVCVAGGGYLLVNSATALARTFGISEWVIGITVVAAGTSVPELAVSLVAAVKKRYGISAGNLIGSDIFNILGVLGVAALIRPLEISTNAFPSLYFLIAAIVVVIIFMRTGWRVTRAEGLLLIGISILRWYLDFAT